MKIGLCIPTLNAEAAFSLLLPALADVRPILHRQLLIDSSSTDATVSLAQRAGFETISIARSEFDHGGTRQMAIDVFDDCDIVVFLTQDAVPTGADSFGHLIEAFGDPEVSCAYGRQLPRIGAGPIEAHARLFSYPPISRKKSASTIPELGLRSAIVSNSFAAYRRSALTRVGGFPSGTLFGEDTLTGAKFLLAGQSIAYVGNATVYHSHDYSLLQEFRRYFDNGVFYSRERWIIEKFGKAEGSGLKYVISELKHLLATAPTSIPRSIISALCKYSGYKAGSLERHIPTRLKVLMSMNPSFWKRELSQPLDQ